MKGSLIFDSFKELVQSKNINNNTAFSVLLMNNNAIGLKNFLFMIEDSLEIEDLISFKVETEEVRRYLATKEKLVEKHMIEVLAEFTMGIAINFHKESFDEDTRMESKTFTEIIKNMKEKCSEKSESLATSGKPNSVLDSDKNGSNFVHKIFQFSSSSEIEENLLALKNLMKTKRKFQCLRHVWKQHLSFRRKKLQQQNSFSDFVEFPGRNIQSK